MWLKSVVILLYSGFFIKIGDCMQCKNNQSKQIFWEGNYDNGSYSVVDLRSCGNERLKINQDLSQENYLVASKNSFSKLEDNTFLNIPNLLKMDLRDNKIKEISTGAFTGLSNLTDLYLDNNLIEELRVGTFDPLAKLKVLGLQNNKIKILMKGIFEKNQNLKYSYFDRNEIFAVGPNVLKSGREWNMTKNQCVDENFLEKATNLTDGTKRCLENYRYLKTKKGLKETISVNKETSTIIICVETVALIICFIIILCQCKSSRDPPTNSLNHNFTSDNAESLYSNTNANVPGQQGPELNYATLNMMSTNSPSPVRSDEVIYSQLKRK
jgi:hypothetical protein